MPLASAITVPSTRDLVEGLAEARERTLAIVAPIADEALAGVHSRLMSPLAWDLGHIAAFEDLWVVHRWGGEPMLRVELADVYDAFETPRARRGELAFLAPEDARDYLAEVRARVLELTAARGTGDGWIHEMIIQHELQHGETMLQAVELARLEGGAPASPGGARPAPGGREQAGETGLELVEVPAGSFEQGAPAGRFSYDNERPRHTVELPAFRIGRVPITNADFLAFVEDGGYRRRECWSDEGWAWKHEHQVGRPGGWSDDRREWGLSGWEPLDPDRPVTHVSWYEADAFARAHDARLPSESEWEKAATSEPGGERGRGALGSVGEVWEWTSSAFVGYPGFVAHPYAEYSEVFFGDTHRVLRGGSWATHRRVATPTFRNWDLPQRRQIFAGLRIARDWR